MMLNLPCRMCHRPVKVTVFQWMVNAPVFCRADEVQVCMDTFTALYCDPPEEDPEPDPDSIPPEDIDVCPFCEGVGEVIVRRDWQTGAYETAQCVPCGGSGEVNPSWLAPERML